MEENLKSQHHLFRLEEHSWFIMFWIKILCQIYAFQTFSLGVYFAFQFPESSLLKCDIFVVYMKSTL